MVVLKFICVAISLLCFSGSFSYVKETIEIFGELNTEQKLQRIITFVAGILIGIAPISWFIF